MIWTGLPVVSCPYMPAAEMPMPCCPRLMRSRWKLDPYKSFAKIRGICWRMMPGPLSVTVIRNRLAWLAGVERVVDGLLDAGEQRLARIVEPQKMPVLGEELGNGDLPLASPHLDGGYRRRRRRGGRTGLRGVQLPHVPIQTESHAGTQVFPSPSSVVGVHLGSACRETCGPPAALSCGRRTAMCLALAGGKARPAGELAARAGVSAQTASNHLAKLIAGRILRVEQQGRWRY